MLVVRGYIIQKSSGFFGFEPISLPPNVDFISLSLLTYLNDILRSGNLVSYLFAKLSWKGGNGKGKLPILGHPIVLVIVSEIHLFIELSLGVHVPWFTPKNDFFLPRWFVTTPRAFSLLCSTIKGNNLGKWLLFLWSECFRRFLGGDSLILNHQTWSDYPTVWSCSLPFNHAILHKFAKERMEKTNHELQYILASTLIFPKMGKLLKITIKLGSIIS